MDPPNTSTVATQWNGVNASRLNPSTLMRRLTNLRTVMTRVHVRVLVAVSLYTPMMHRYCVRTLMARWNHREGTLPKKKKKKKTNTTGAAALIDNPDQRIAQDIDTFTTRFADIVVKAFNAPLQIVWYSVTTYRNLGWLGPVVCYAFFLLGSLVNKVLISPLVGLVFAQDQCEGNFRFSHVYLRTHAESVAFYRGEARERQVNDSYLWLLVANKWRIVRRHFPLYLHQQLFGYIGSILNYVIIGYAVFYRGYFAGDNAGEVGMKISQVNKLKERKQQQQ
eukprot:GEZU01009518.1.p1 GENE.GEZU01009518.1~~GEZU01009518.1.p1  ORF type:complete len:279 (+),score=36.64 GEZU01009518.1:56-892(+)